MKKVVIKLDYLIKHNRIFLSIEITLASTVDFSSVAISCGYKTVFCVDNLNGFAKSLKESLKKQGPIFIDVKIKSGSIDNLRRPTIHPSKVARRFKNFLKV